MEGSFTSLGLFARTLTRSAVGRSIELASARREVEASKKGLACLSVQGEPGIGKTHLVLAIEQLAREEGLLTVGVTADEEIRGPFLLARNVFGALSLADLPADGRAMQAVLKVAEALSNEDDPGLQGLSPDRRSVRLFDLAAIAVRSVAAERPLAILLDDVQWADEDSLRMFRYVIRANPLARVLLVISARSDELAQVHEAVTLLADVERMGLLRRVKLSRFVQPESSQFLQQVLGGPVDLATVAVMHAQAEGVPFILAEQAKAYRDGGLVQQVDGVWRLARKADRLLPSAVRTLIQRRAAHLPLAVRTTLAEAGVLGRSINLRDLRDMKQRAGDGACEVQQLADALAPAVAAGLLAELPGSQNADFRFTHEGVRDYVLGTLAPARRRALHEAVVHLLSGGQARAESLPLIAHHAMAAGQPELCARAALEAAKNALKSSAPEEVMRLVALAQPAASDPRTRVSLLLVHDDALAMLRRPAARLESLAQVSALAGALGDPLLEMDVMLRRAAAFRLSHEYDSAAELARKVALLAGQQGSPDLELSAYLELGQDLLHCDLGEGYAPTASEVDLDGAADAYSRALALAERLGNEVCAAAASRELGVIAVARFRAWFVDRVKAGDHIPILKRVAAGERLADMLPETGVQHLVQEAGSRYQHALDLYERLGDRRGAMSTIIAMAYMTWGPDIHIPGSAKRIEEIRHLATQMASLTKESERSLADAQMLYGVHVYSRAKGFFDAAITKGIQAFDAARALGEHSIEFAASGGLALANADIEDLPEANAWLERAAAIAAAAPTASRARLLELWRGRVCAASGDAAGMEGHLQRAIQMAADQGCPAARAESLGRLSLEASRLGTGPNDGALLTLATDSAREVLGLTPVLPGKAPWGAEAHAALARVAMAGGDLKQAVDEARAAVADLRSMMSEDLLLDVRLPAAEVFMRAGDENEREELIGGLRLTLTFLLQQIEDDRVRVRWLRSPTGRKLTEVAGQVEPQLATAPGKSPEAARFNDQESRLLRLLIDARTNAEIADELGLTVDQVAHALIALYARIGATTRAQATSNALMGKLV